MVPQNRVRPRRQHIVYYWRNDTNTQLNPIQPHKNQCFTLTLVSLKSALALTLTVALSLLPLHTCFLHTLQFHSTALSPISLFIGEWRSIDSNPCAEPTTTMTKVMVVGERLTKMLTIATNLHLDKIFPFNPRDQSMLPLMRHMALHPEGAQHREMLTKSKQCWNLIPETHFVSMSAGLSAVPIFCSRISPSSIISRTK